MALSGGRSSPGSTVFVDFLISWSNLVISSNILVKSIVLNLKNLKNFQKLHEIAKNLVGSTRVDLSRSEACHSECNHLELTNHGLGWSKTFCIYKALHSTVLRAETRSFIQNHIVNVNVNVIQRLNAADWHGLVVQCILYIQ